MVSQQNVRTLRTAGPQIRRRRLENIVYWLIMKYFLFFCQYSMFTVTDRNRDRFSNFDFEWYTRYNMKFKRKLQKILITTIDYDRGIHSAQTLLLSTPAFCC